jgi:hypothetical protein
LRRRPSGRNSNNNNNNNNNNNGGGDGDDSDNGNDDDGRITSEASKKGVLSANATSKLPANCGSHGLRLASAAAPPSAAGFPVSATTGVSTTPRRHVYLSGTTVLGEL